MARKYHHIGKNKGRILGELECLTKRKPTHELHIEWCYPVELEQGKAVCGAGKRLLVRNTKQIEELVRHLLSLVGTSVTNVGWMPLPADWTKSDAVR